MQSQYIMFNDDTLVRPNRLNWHLSVSHLPSYSYDVVEFIGVVREEIIQFCLIHIQSSRLCQEEVCHILSETELGLTTTQSARVEAGPSEGAGCVSFPPPCLQSSPT